MKKLFLLLIGFITISLSTTCVAGNMCKVMGTTGSVQVEAQIIDSETGEVRVTFYNDTEEYVNISCTVSVNNEADTQTVMETAPPQRPTSKTIFYHKEIYNQYVIVSDVSGAKCGE